MPANLPPHYQKLEDKLRQAREPGEKLAILEEMFALLPKHKGTDKMQADLKKKMSKLRHQPQGKGSGKSTFFHHVNPYPTQRYDDHPWRSDDRSFQARGLQKKETPHPHQHRVQPSLAPCLAAGRCFQP